MTASTVHGYPRIGGRRELKVATEAYWAGRTTAEGLEATGRELRRDTWTFLRDAGIEEIPSNHFSFYDQVLDTIAMVGAVPERFGQPARASASVDLGTYFALARGWADAAPLEMTKWFDTNYHYLVPELGPDTSFGLRPRKPLAELAEAAELGITTRPVLVGPVTFLLLGKAAAGAPAGFDRLSLLDDLLEVYAELLEELAAAGAGWVQLDEPAFVQDRTPAELDALARAYDRLGRLPRRPRLLVSSYFDHLGDALGVLAASPVDGLGLDFTRGGERNLRLLAKAGGLPGKRLVAGVVDGRNVWVNDLEQSLALLATLRGLADEVVVAPSCSLQHVPLDVEAEPDLDPALRPWLAFARQKVAEVVALARGLNDGTEAVSDALAERRRVLDERRASRLATNPAVRQRLASTDQHHARRASPYGVRAKAQQARLGLPLLPTTTIGSFPQTPDLRKVRAAARRGEIDQAAYTERMEAEIAEVIRLQEELGLDVLVHGEPERNDMVQYFGEQLDGYAVTEYGWVQSYGTRYVRPPIIFGDVRRPRPMTVAWSRYAQSRTDQAGEGHADRSGDDGEVVVPPGRPAAGGDHQAGRARPAGRGRRPGGRRRRHHPGRRARDPRGHAAPPRAPRRLPGVGRGGVPAGDRGGPRRDPDPHAHVLLGVRRHPAGDRRAGRRRDLGGGRPLGHEPGRRPAGRRLRAGDRARRLRHPFAASATGRRDGDAAAAGDDGPRTDPAVGQPGLRPQDPRLRRGEGRPPQPRGRRQDRAGTDW